MLFDLHPKELPENLFGRKSELDTILNHLTNRRWVSLLGPRMVGKTSLVKVARTKLKPHSYTTLYANLMGFNSLRGLLDALLLALNADTGLSKKVKKLLGQIRGINFGPAGFILDEEVKPVTTASQFLSVLGQCSGKLVVFLDEIQELHGVSIHLQRILANTFATYPDISFCFTGFQSGLVRALNEPGPSSPLFGRSPYQLEINTFSIETAKEFLRKGFQEFNMEIKQDHLGEVIDYFGGIPGWLTLYGNAITISGLSHAIAMRYCRLEAFKIAQQSLEHYLTGRNRIEHMAAMRAIALNLTWSEIRNAINASTGRVINDGTLKNIIDALKLSYIIEKYDGVYRLTDPVIRRFLFSGGMVR